MRGVVTLLIFFNLVSYVHANVNNYIGEYSIYIESVKLFPEKKELQANIHVNVHLEQGEGVAYFALPIENTEKLKYVLSSKSSKNLVLLGYPKSPSGFAICQISLNKNTESTISMAFKNAIFRLKNAAQSDKVFSMPLYIEESFSILKQNNFDPNRWLRLKEVTFMIPGYSDSYPISNIIDNTSRRKFSIQDFQNNENSYVLYINKRQNETFLYWVLGIMGIFIGVITSPKIVSSPAKAKYSIVFSMIVLLGMVAFFFGSLEETQRYGDTTTIVTYGTTFGIVIGFLIGALQFYFRLNNNVDSIT